uniref:LITAF domain-containing protein n=1 Tax=Bionectria ochroleuca TaxID=29856 RepID=A0A0B7KG97_BIOOC
MATQDQVLPVPPPTYETQSTKGGANVPVHFDTSNGHPAGAPQMVTPLASLGDHPQFIDCPFCNRRAQTRLNKKGGSMQIVVGAVLCLFCVCLTCLPCILHWCENTEYYCTNCNQKLALRTYDGAMQVFSPPQPSRAAQPSQPEMQQATHYN